MQHLKARGTSLEPDDEPNEEDTANNNEEELDTLPLIPESDYRHYPEIFHSVRNFILNGAELEDMGDARDLRWIRQALASVSSDKLTEDELLRFKAVNELLHEFSDHLDPLRLPEVIATNPQVLAREFSGPEAWKYEANCYGIDPELFYPGRGESTKEAKEVCRQCQVMEPCLEYALENSEKFGIWGGHSERERRRIRKQRAKAKKEAAAAAKKAAEAAAKKAQEEAEQLTTVTEPEIISPNDTDGVVVQLVEIRRKKVAESAATA